MNTGFGQKIIIKGEETHRKLVWSDFTAKVDNSSPYWAFTGYRIKSNYSNLKVVGDSITIGKFEVIVELDPDKSWAKADKLTDELLIHEQGHFNIGILCMRELVNVFNQSKFTRTNFETDFKKIMNETTKKYKEMGVKYDTDTEHFKNKEQQAKWNVFFAQNLSN